MYKILFNTFSCFSVLFLLFHMKNKKSTKKLRHLLVKLLDGLASKAVYFPTSKSHKKCKKAEKSRKSMKKSTKPDKKGSKNGWNIEKVLQKHQKAVDLAFHKYIMLFFHRAFQPLKSMKKNKKYKKAFSHFPDAGRSSEHIWGLSLQIPWSTWPRQHGHAIQKVLSRVRM